MTTKKKILTLAFVLLFPLVIVVLALWCILSLPLLCAGWILGDFGFYEEEAWLTSLTVGRL